MLRMVSTRMLVEFSLTMPGGLRQEMVRAIGVHEQ